MQLTFFKGIFLGAATAAVMFAGTAALAGNGVNDVFNLGVENTVDQQSTLKGTTSNPQLNVNNQQGGDAAIGIHGVHSSGSGKGAGVQGDTASTAGGATGVLGRATSTNSAPSSAAVTGLNLGKGNGVYGKAPNSYGVFGEGRYGVVGSSLFSGASSGVYGTTKLGFAGVEGHANGGLYGVYGRSSSSTEYPGGAPDTPGAGVFGIHSYAYGTTPGVRGETNSNSQTAAAILGRANATNPSRDVVAVRGINKSTNGYGMGVWGSVDGSGWGVLGEAGANGKGVVGKVGGAGTGVWGEAGPNGVGVKGVGNGTYASPAYAGQFVGEVDVQGYLRVALRSSLADSDCIYPAHRGRLTLLWGAYEDLYIAVCTAAGWKYVKLYP